MAVLAITTGTEGLAALKSRWDSAFRTAPNEESVIIKDFDKPTGVERIDNTLYIRIVPIVTPASIASSSKGSDAEGYQNASITAISATPSFYGSIVQLPDNLISNLGAADTAALEAAYRKQSLAALDQQFDALGGNLATAVGTIKGPGNFDKTSLLDAINAVVTGAKDHLKIGVDNVHVKYHPTQWQHIMAVAEIANAYARGDKQNPNVKGVVMDAWGATFAETGNVKLSGGFYYNMFFVKSAFVQGWNLKPTVKPMQDFEFSRRLVVEAEGGCAEVFDGDAAVHKSA